MCESVTGTGAAKQLLPSCHTSASRNCGARASHCPCCAYSLPCCRMLQNATTKGALTSFAWLVGNLLAFTTSEGWIRVSHVLLQ